MRMPDGLDEAPGAYKDIAQVIANERDLVKPLVELAPIKGGKTKRVNMWSA